MLFSHPHFFDKIDADTAVARASKILAGLSFTQEVTGWRRNMLDGALRSFFFPFFMVTLWPR